MFLNGHTYRICFESVFSPTVICSHAYPQPHSQKFPNRCSSVFAVNCLFSEIILYIDYVLFFRSLPVCYFFLPALPLSLYHIISHHISMFDQALYKNLFPCLAGQFPTSPWLNKTNSPHFLAVTVAAARRKKLLRQMDSWCDAVSENLVTDSYR